MNDATDTAAATAPNAAAAFDHILIMGHGRSGTNWLLDLLDMSPHTHCRNEPNELGSEVWEAMPCGWVNQEREPTFGERWDAALSYSGSRMGGRDPRLHRSKPHVHPLGQRLKSDRLVKGPKFRKLLSLVQPSLGRPEWPMPHWYGDRAALSRATPVLKFTQVPGWAAWSLAHRPRVFILHIVRHPGGFLNSYLNRWLVHADARQAAADNRRRLRLVAQADPTWAARLGDIASMGLEESELWFWRYAAETIHAAGAGRPNYHLIVYENLTDDASTTLREAYQACGLPWDDGIAQEVEHTTGRSSRIASAWRDKLTAEQVTLVERVLEDSPLRTWWEGN